MILLIGSQAWESAGKKAIASPLPSGLTGHNHARHRAVAREAGRDGADDAISVISASVAADGMSGHHPIKVIAALRHEAVVTEALGEQAAAHSALEQALDLAEPDGALTPFLLAPSPDLLDRHARRYTAHASLIAAIRDMLAGNQPGPPPSGPRPMPEPLSGSEIRVLRYLPTNLNAPEIARELYVSPNTVKTHTRNLYAKLGTHSRAETVERARALGLLAPGRHRGGP